MSMFFFFLVYQRVTVMKKIGILFSVCAFKVCIALCIDENGILPSYKRTCCNMQFKILSLQLKEVL